MAEERQERLFIAEALRLMGEGKYIKEPLHELMRRGGSEPSSAQEIVERVISNGGLEVTPA